MKVLILGAGRVGTGVASWLTQHSVDVTVIDNDPARVRFCADSLDVRAFEGHACDPDVLKEAGAYQADMIIAVTHQDEVNMVACEVAHALFDVQTAMARVRFQNYLKSEWQDLFTQDHLAIDAVISPELDVARAILRRLEIQGTLEVLDFYGGNMVVVGASVGERCTLIDIPLKEIPEILSEFDMRIMGLRRKKELLTPERETTLQMGDDVYVAVKKEHTNHVLGLFGIDEGHAKNVLVIGGGNIGFSVAERLERRHAQARVTVIEADRRKALHVADKLKNALVLHGSGLDMDILREAGIEDFDAAVAVTDDDRTNILACVLAKRQGCHNTLGLVSDVNYASLSQTFGLDNVISPQIITLSNVLKRLRRGKVVRLYTVFNGLAELIEFELTQRSFLVGRTLREITLPEGVVLGFVYRNNEVIVIGEGLSFQQGDHVVCFVPADPEIIHRIEELIRPLLLF